MHDAVPLIEVDQQSRLAKVLAGVSILILVSTAVVDRLWPAELPRLVGEEKAEYGKAQRSKNWRDGSMARWIAKDLVSQSRTRLSLAPWWSMALLALGDSGRRDLIIGDDGWLFLRRRVELTEAELSGAPTLAVNMLLALRRRFALHGSELRFLPVPRKAVVGAARLPEGIPSHRAFDEEIVARLQGAGAPTVDLLEAWRELAPEECYLKLDTHWARGGQEAAVRAVASQFPDLRGELGAVELVWKEEPGPAALLRFAGFYKGYPAWDRMANETMARAHLKAEALAARLGRRDYRGFTAVAGTSFSRGLPFVPLLIAELEAPVEDASESGASFVRPLGTLLGRRAGGDPLPKVVLVEFPIYQTVTAYQRSAPVLKALGAVFRRLGLPASGDPELKAEDYDPGRNASRLIRGRRVSIPAGSILTSGDGVVQLRLESTSAEETKWSVKAGALEIPVTLPPGGGVRYVPIIEGAAWHGGALASPKNAAARKDELQVSAVLDPGAKRSLGPERAGADGEVTFDLSAVPVGPHSLLHLEWKAGRGSKDVVIQVSGTSAAGESISLTWHFPKARGSAAVLSLGAFQGGSLLGVKCSGTNGSVKIAKRTFTP